MTEEKPRFLSAISRFIQLTSWGTRPFLSAGAQVEEGLTLPTATLFRGQNAPLGSQHVARFHNILNVF